MSELSNYERLMRGVIPYLTIDGVDKAIEFYQSGLGAIVHGEVTRAPDSGKILNVLLEINGGGIMLMDHFPDRGDASAQAGKGFLMQIVSHDGQAFWDRAIGAGCTIIAPFEPQFWGDTWGVLHDAFGIGWAVNQPSTENQAKASNL
jgi:PhnB protein